MCTHQKQFDFFKRNQSTLLHDYYGKFIVISENLEVIPFETLIEAYCKGAKLFGEGRYMIQECTEKAVAPKRLTNTIITQ